MMMVAAAALLWATLHEVSELHRKACARVQVHGRVEVAAGSQDIHHTRLGGKGSDKGY